MIKNAYIKAKKIQEKYADKENKPIASISMGELIDTIDNATSNCDLFITAFTLGYLKQKEHDKYRKKAAK